MAAAALIGVAWLVVVVAVIARGIASVVTIGVALLVIVFSVIGAIVVT